MKETTPATSDIDATRHWSLRRRVVGRILKFFFGRPPGRPKLKPAEIRRALLIRHDRLGDYIITTPVIETLKRIAPDVEIDVLGSPVNVSLIRHDRRIKNVTVWGHTFMSRIKAIRTCRDRDYDITFQLVTRHTTLPIIVAGLCTPRGRVVGRGHTYNRWLFDHRLNRFPIKHLAEQTFEIFLEGFDLDGPPPAIPPYSLMIPSSLIEKTRKEIHHQGLDEKNYILLNLSASEEYRTLTKERAAMLAIMLHERFAPNGLQIALTGAPEDHEQIEWVAEKSGGSVLMFSSILKAAIGVAQARLLISPDTGSVHIASALGTPVVAYYSESLKPAMWSPVHVPHHIVIGSKEKETDSIELEEIVESVNSLIEHQSA